MEYLTNSPKYVLTSKAQCSKKCKDGKSRNFLLYFLNEVQILKQKLPYNEEWERGFDKCTAIYDEYILNGKLYQKRKTDDEHGMVDGVWTVTKRSKIRKVSYPLSKQILEQFQIPRDYIILIDDYRQSFHFDGDVEDDISIAIQQQQLLCTTSINPNK